MPVQAAYNQSNTSRSSDIHLDDDSYERLYYALYIIVSSRGNILKFNQLHQAPTSTNQHLSKQQSGYATHPSNVFPGGRLMQFSSKQHLSMQHHHPSTIHAKLLSEQHCDMVSSCKNSDSSWEKTYLPNPNLSSHRSNATFHGL
jgi:hypothetical protein